MDVSSRFALRLSAFVAVATAMTALLITGVAGAAGHFTTVATDFESPLFGLAVAPGNRLVVADACADPTEVRNGATALVADLPGVTDVAPIGRGEMLALTSEFAPGALPALYRVSQGRVQMVANIGDFEAAEDPADDGVESNPFDLARMAGGKTLVADAAGNSVLVVDEMGNVDWVAALPQHDVECPVAICGVPGVIIDADPVATTVAIGPDGAYYVGELTGFPATPGTSRIWRIEPGTRHAKCGISSACSIVGTGFTSIIDINFGPDGMAYVVELDEASWLGLEIGFGVGGTLNACETEGTWSCSVRAAQLPVPTAVALDGSSIYTTLYSLEAFGIGPAGDAQVARLP